MGRIRIVGGPTGALIRVYGTDGRAIDGISGIELNIKGPGLIDARVTFCRVEVDLEAEATAHPDEDGLLVRITDPITGKSTLDWGTFRSKREE